MEASHGCLTQDSRLRAEPGKLKRRKLEQLYIVGRIRLESLKCNLDDRLLEIAVETGPPLA